MESNYLSFVPSIASSRESLSEDYYFIFSGSKILLNKKGTSIDIPRKKDLPTLLNNSTLYFYLGDFMGRGCYCLNISNDNVPNSDNFELVELRTLVGKINYELFLTCGKALQILNWDRNHKYCGRCGTQTQNVEDQRAKKCPHCGFISYPRISPAIIVAIIKEDEILLAHNNSFPAGLYTVIAGFADPGETLEQCVKREIFEEVGLKVKNIKYFGSEPWPFPDSLMIAFTAEYMEGAIKIDGTEIGAANWYKANELPQIPSKGCIAREMIEWFKTNSNTLS